MDTSILRLAVVFCADNNYEIKPKIIHKKIIESLFVDNKNDFITVYKLIDEIKNKYDFIFDEKEIYEIVAKDKNFNIIPHKSEVLSINLVQSRYLTLKNKAQKNNIDCFVGEFHKTITELQKFKNKEKTNKLLGIEKKAIKQQIIDGKVRNDLIKYQMRGYIYALFSIICMVFIALSLFNQEYIPEKEIMPYVLLLLSGFFIFCVIQINRRLISIKSKNEKIEEIKQKYNDEFFCKFYSKL
jgi:hypothetical protein